MKKLILLISFLFIFPMLYAQNNALETAGGELFPGKHRLRLVKSLS